MDRRLEEEEFLGRDVLHAQKTNGVDKTMVGFEMTERAIARHGHSVFHNGQPGRRGHQRHADAVPEESHRHGLRAARIEGAGHGTRDRYSRPQGEGRCRAAAVLQEPKK
jgi:glycine cleavage system aminomethyltransferase T